MAADSCHLAATSTAGVQIITCLQRTQQDTRMKCAAIEDDPLPSANQAEHKHPLVGASLNSLRFRHAAEEQIGMVVSEDTVIRGCAEDVEREALGGVKPSRVRAYAGWWYLKTPSELLSCVPVQPRRR